MSGPGRPLPAHPGSGAYRPEERYWRSLEELERAPEFERALAAIDNEANLAGGFDRRDLFKYLGVSLALAGLSACTRQPAERIVPYVHQPEGVIPGGRPLYFATAMTIGGFATGLLVESHEGRPTKVEGNPRHPASLGATDPFGQAAVYDLYDPDRSQTLTYLEEIRTWPAFLAAMRQRIEAARVRRGAGFAILTETVSSPTLARQLSALLAELPEARWVQWEPVSRDHALAGARIAFGEPVDLLADLSKAAVIVSLGSDFLASGPGHLRRARDFGDRRRQLASGAGPGVRLYAVEAAPTLTGASADHRLPTTPAGVEAFARALGSAFGVRSGAPSGPAADPVLAAAIADLKAHPGASAVLAGDAEPPEVHAIAHALNAALGNFGATLVAVEPAVAKPADQLAELRALAEEMDAGRVETLLIVEGNPAFNAPADLRFAERMQKVAMRAHLSLFKDETSALCHWHVPQSHFLESWGDARAFDGTASIVQPLIAPLYDGKSAIEVMAAFSGEPETAGYDLVRATWKDRLGADFESEWTRALREGVLPETASRPKTVRVDSGAVEAALARRSPGRGAEPPPPTAGSGEAANAGTFHLLLRPDPGVHDGRFANNGWLQELARPITKLAWDNAAIVSIATAARLGARKEDLVRLTVRGASVTAPVWIEPGVPDSCVLVHFGQGRRRAGRLGTGAGFDAYPLRFADALWSASGIAVEKVEGRRPLACTQLHQNMEGRGTVRAATLAEYRRDPGFVHGEGVKETPGPEDTLYEHFPSDTYAWGMAIDLNACVGCNVCEVACQAENNVPVVGREQVRRGREMHWIRIDHYYGGDPANPDHFFQPVPCMHCENAPCELVCPVGATVHSAEGLNDMVYNRCVGTRYCSNNCPYKVRRFNFFHYGLQFRAPSLKMLANPDVTVRWRGVMEKCTYCVQRIQEAKIAADVESRRVRDGEVTPACAQACPTRAIVFGDLADPKSRVSALRSEKRSYGLLASLGTRPRTTYLGAIRNPSPAVPAPVRTDWNEVEPGRETGAK